MNKCILLTAILFTFCATLSCKDKETNHVSAEKKDTVQSEKKVAGKAASSFANNDTLNAFLPKGYFIFEKIHGDLNKDSLADCVLIIKGTDKNNIVKTESGEELDRNPRGIIILFKEKDGYKLALQNVDCFSSENEDGGVYFAPELYIEITKNILSIAYSHGRYGAWSYKFRANPLDFELIGYDNNQGGAVTSSITSINFVTKKKIHKVNVNENAEGGDEVFKETTTRIKQDKLLLLSEIKHFDELDMSFNEE